VTAGTASLTVVQGNDDPTNPRYPKSASVLATGVTFNGNVHINPETDVVLAAVYRETGETSITQSRIVDKRMFLTSSIISQGTAAPTGGSTGSLYYKSDSTLGSSGSGIFVKNSNGDWVEAAQLANNNISDLQLRDSSGLSVIGRSTNSTGDPGDIVAATDGTVLRRSGTSLAFGQVEASGLASDSVTTDKIVNASVTGDKLSNLSVSTGKVVDSAITDAKLRNSAGLSVIGRSANSVGAPADLVAGTDGHVLRRSGTSLGFGTIATDGIANNAVTDGKLRDSAANSVIGRASGTSGDPADIAAGSNGVLRRIGAGTLGFGLIDKNNISGSVNSADTATSAGYATSAGNADTVDNLHASSFLRTDASSTTSGNIGFSRSGLFSITLQHENSDNPNRGRIRFVNGPNDQDIACGDLFAGGNVRYGGSLIFTSSRTLKKNVEDYAEATDVIDQLRPVTFQFINDPDSKTKIGLIAEEVSEVLPIAVDESSGIPSLDHTVLLGLALSGLKEANARITSLEARIAELGG
jgi:hypothetical protein